MQIATDLLAIGTKSLNGGNPQIDIVDEQIDVMGKAILGLTISCARCYNHKFDMRFLPKITTPWLGFSKAQTHYIAYSGGLKRANKANQKLGPLHMLGEDAEARLQAISKQNKELSTLQQREKTLLNKQKQPRRKLPKNFQVRLRELRQNVLAEKSDVAATQSDATAEETKSQKKQSPQKPKFITQRQNHCTI